MNCKPGADLRIQLGESAFVFNSLFCLALLLPYGLMHVVKIGERDGGPVTSISTD